MGNHLAIATVTAALKRMIQSGISLDVPGAQVTTNRPEAPSGNISGASVNLFLYSATPNQAWRNADLRTRRPKGDMVKHGQAGLDLNYIFTFYGNEQRHEPQRLMGSVIQTLVDHPSLSQEMIRDTIAAASIPELMESTLDEQVQSVKFLPSEITTEELSRLWSVFFQIPYSLSFTYQASAVLIQGRKPGKAPLPVRSRRFYTSPTLPAIAKIEHLGAAGEPITMDSRLLVRGQQLKGESVRVQIGEADLTPAVVSNNHVEIDLRNLIPREREQLRAGVQGLRVVLQPPRSSVAQDLKTTTNVLPLVLCPVITPRVQGITLSDVREIDENFFSAMVVVEVNITVSPDQPVFLLLNGEAYPGHDGIHILRSTGRSETSTLLGFELDSIRGGEYLVRVQISGAESPLEVDTTEGSPTHEQYIGPSLNLRT